jgi:hypothetical protein
MKHLSKFFIILAVSVSIAGCSSPVGNISSKGGLDDMWAVPKRVSYELMDGFWRSDLKVLGMYRGAVESIPVNKVTIEIIEDPYAAEPQPTFPYPKEEPYFWRDDYDYGRKIIVLKYRGKEYRYSIEVVDPLGLGPDPWGEEGSGIVVIWLPHPDLDP